VRGRQSPPAKRFVARGCELSARQAERSGKRGCGGGSPHLPSALLPAVASRLQDKPSAAESGVSGRKPHLPSASLPAVASRLQDKPSAAESGDVGAAATTCALKKTKVGYTAVTICESTSVRCLAESQRTAPQAQRLANVGVRTNEHRLFDSVDHSTG
jgi:hypothetical protein